MEYISENLKTPVKGSYDVIVVGGGPAGCGAAIAAGRSGASVLLVEKNNCLGGMWTSGFVNPLFDSENKDKGIIREIINKLDEKNVWGGFRDISFNYEYMKVILENMCKEAGVEVLYNTFYSNVITEENKVKGIICENISGRCAYMAKGVIDCSADGCVCADAGAEFNLGDDEGICQAMTLMFIVSNVPKKYLNTDFMMYEQLENVYKKENKEVPFRYPFLITIPNSDFAVIQFTHMHEYNPIDAGAISAATAEGRRQMIEAIELLKKYDEDFKELNLVTSASILGVRESRRIVGDYTVTLDDLLCGKHFEDGICDVKFNVDIHNGKNSSQKCFDVECYQIPYRCLIPKGLENILVAGRCISGTHEAMASYRVTADCCVMGEAAGKAMAYAAKNNLRTREIEINNI